MERRGSALAIALSFCVIVGIMAAALMMLGRSQYGVVFEGMHRVGKRHAAEAGLSRALWRLNNIGNASSPFNKGEDFLENFNTGGHAVTIDLTYTGPTAPAEPTNDYDVNVTTN